MTDAEYKFLEELYLRAKSLRQNINTSFDENEYMALCTEYDRIDLIEEMLNNSSQKVRPLDEKIIDIRNYVMQRTNGMVDLNRETVIGILEKFVL